VRYGAIASVKVCEFDALVVAWTVAYAPGPVDLPVTNFSSKWGIAAVVAAARIRSPRRSATYPADGPAASAVLTAGD
jgi:hypothetical protein